jgi:phage gpG-like protein
LEGRVAHATDGLRHGFSGEHPILVRSGRLKESFVKRSHGEHILDAHPRYIDFGSKVPYAIYHQTGTGKMSRRPLIFIDKKDVGDIVQAFREHILKNVTVSGSHARY